MEPDQEQKLPQPKPAPVMDVVPPRAAPASPPAAPTEPLKMPPPDPAAQAPSKSDEPAKTDQKEAAKPVPKSAKPKAQSAGSGARLAIVATVIIALTLGAMMVYAYLRTNGGSGF